MAVKHPPINSGWKPGDGAYGDLFPDRINVCGKFGWEIFRGDSQLLETHPTFAEAINAAQRIARNR